MQRTALAGQLLFVGAVLAGWEAVSQWRWVDPSLLPPFSAVIQILWVFLRDGAFLADLQVTGVEVLTAFVIAAPLAISTGFLLGEKLHWGEVVNPVIHVVLAVPQSIFLPIFILAFGIGFLEKVIFGITHAYFVIVVNTVAAVRAIPAPLVVAARSFGATPVQIYTRIYLPAMLPLVVTGLRLGMIFNIIGVLLAEMYASRHGIGRLIFSWGEAFQIRELLAGILLVSVATIALNEVMRLWEARVGRWRSATLGS
ncbi:MAG: ABC transporter permease [Deltaproteobacteria bacterium]|nr:ABC transporter permease [Deltaproteobacteria bacterium]